MCVKYRREPAFLLFALACPIAGLMLVRLDARLAGGAASTRDRLATIAAFLFMLAIWSASFLLWRRAGGFFGIRDTGESAAIYLSSFQVRGIVSFFLPGPRGEARIRRHGATTTFTTRTSYRGSSP